MQDPRCVSLPWVYTPVNHNRFLGCLGRKIRNRYKWYRDPTQAPLDSLLLEDHTLLFRVLDFLNFRDKRIQHRESVRQTIGEIHFVIRIRELVLK